MLLKADVLKATVNEADETEQTPLHLAIIALHRLQNKLGVDQIDSVDSTADEDSNAKDQILQCIGTTQLLLDHGAQPEAQNREGLTALHLAVPCGEPSVLQSIIEKMEPEHLLIRDQHQETALSVALKLEGQQRRATAIEVFLNSDFVKIAKFDQENIWDRVLYKTRKNNTMPPESEGWNVIRWAAHYQDPKILRQLISSSPETADIEKALKSVLGSTLKLSRTEGVFGKDLRRTGNPNVRGETTDEEGSEQEIFESKELGKLKDIIRDPPFTRVHKEPLEYDLPRYKIEKTRKDALKRYKANIVQFLRADGVMTTLEVRRKVRDVIYKAGPTKLMQTATDMHRAVASLDGDKVEIDLDFTWVHLPATNMEWMNDLVTRILKEEHCSTHRYYEVKSFFQDSWVEVPDKKAESRMMRPRSVFRQQKQTADTEPGSRAKPQAPWFKITDRPLGKRQRQHVLAEEGETEDGKIQTPMTAEVGITTNKDKGDITENPEEDDGNEKIQALRSGTGDYTKSDSGFVAASAIYMPYFCFSTNLDKVQEPLVPKNKYDNLSAEYSTETMSVVHRSPTLDEWYYHFAKDDESANEDRIRRNESQVVAKFLGRGKNREQNGQNKRTPMSPNQPSDLTLIRINQIWIWTIKNKWLITANSCLPDEGDGTLVQAMLDQLSKQAKYGGRESQPRSADEMSKLIVDYFVGSYERLSKIERQPKTTSTDAASSQNQELADRRELSISQIYSSYMNRIGRDEMRLYETSRDRRQNQRQDRERDLLQKLTFAFRQWKEILENGPEPSPSALPDAGTTMEDAFEQAEKLYGDIKDVRDELNILKSVAQHQRTVQRGLYKKMKKIVDLPAAYVVNDIAHMEAVAERIESAVNTTISLQQNEIANYQAKLAGDQGKILMVFTFATLLFTDQLVKLPLSFLSSLFALDVSSFLQTPTWAYLVIFKPENAQSIHSDNDSLALGNNLNLRNAVRGLLCLGLFLIIHHALYDAISIGRATPRCSEECLHWHSHLDEAASFALWKAHGTKAEVMA
ncbi:hypothetical protein CPAR01_05523 [Colletotrichum paranaense]|uniref:Ankyrin repeat protein n=1 Tax=Colletotrichum paranaense TaxID=1914294 RepID=A0ABQ9ST24_9PEZI|nr:uncharacterized protein CPAR01_05523 [Colletotrichum paranaense]KAK1542136.1 hypothetical protein CPAR01_05523 [Colletotrichum paranaense]